MSKMTLEQAKELLKHIQENPESLKQLEELAKAAQKDPHAQPIFSEKILKPSDKESVVLNPNVKKPLKNAEDSKQTEMEMSPQGHEKKRVGELTKKIKACIEKMQMDKMSKESMDKDDKPHAPGTSEDKAHDVAEEGESVKEAIHSLKDKSAGSKEELLSHLRSLKDKSQLRSPENREVGKESHEKAETGHEKGVNLAANFQINRPGVSHAGISARSAKINKDKGGSNWVNVNEAKDRHEKILSEIKNQPKPNLPKSELEKAKQDEVLPAQLKEKIKNLIDTHKVRQRADRNNFSPAKIKGVHQKKGTYSNLPEGSTNLAATHGVINSSNNWISIENQLKHARRKKSKEMAREIKQMPEPKLKSELEKSVHGIPGKNRPLHSKGINEPVSVSAPKHKGDASEKSLAGLKVRRKDVSGAKEAHKEILQEMKDQPKANLPKSELNKESHKDLKGVHKPHFMASIKSGTSDVGARMLSGVKPSGSLKQYAKGVHERVLSELKAMKKPNLPKAELEKQLMSPPFSMTEKSEGYYRDLVKRCWEGYEPTPGKKAYSKGSCKPIKKQQIEPAPTTKIIPPVIPSGSGNGGSKPKKPFKKPLMNSELEKESLQAVPKKVLVEEMSGDPKEKGSLRQHSYWKTPGKESNYPRTKFPAAASDKMRLIDMMSGKYKMHGPKGILKKEKAKYYENLVKSTLEKAKIFAGPGRPEKLGTVLGQMNTEDYTSKDNVKDQKSVRLFYESKNNPTKENISAFHESQKIKLPVKETDKKVGQLAEGVGNRYFSRKQGKKKSIKDKKPFVSPKKVKTKNTFLEENKNPETLGKTQKVLVGGRVMYTDRSPQGPHQVLAYSIKDRAKTRKKRKPKKTKVRKSEQHYQDLIKKILDN